MQTNEPILSRMEEDIVLHGLSEATKRNYLRDARFFLNWAGRPAEMLGEEDIGSCLNHLIAEKKLSVSTVNCYGSAICFLFEVTMNRPLNRRQVPRLKQRRRLPEILTRSEVSRVIGHASTLRNKAILMTIYGAGIRLSELCNLQIRDIDSESMRIFVRYGKGGKDRYTLLSQSNLVILREYWKVYRPNHPEGWLFLGRDGSRQIHWRTVEKAFGTAAERAGISKDVSTHTLRHCFATHLLEDGVNIMCIKRLLGHASLQSTSIYLHLQKFESELKSPLDSLPVAQTEGGE